MARYESVLDAIGNTPLIRLARLAPEGVNVYAKLDRITSYNVCYTKLLRSFTRIVPMSSTRW